MRIAAVAMCVLVACGGGDGGSDASVQCRVPRSAAVVNHQVDCRGTIAALGINSEGKSSFEATQSTCRGQYGLCGCPGDNPRADDGTYGGPFGVRCDDGLCTSYSLDPIDGGVPTYD